MASNSVTIKDHYHLAHSREKVWEKLNDPEILAACIRGCVRVERRSSKKFTAVIRAHVGEIKKDFDIDLDVQDDAAPAEYCLSSEVRAGLLGRVNAGADVNLTIVDVERTDLHYSAIIEGRGVLGKALPLIETAAARRVRDFFDQFVEHL